MTPISIAVTIVVGIFGIAALLGGAQIFRKSLKSEIIDDQERLLKVRDDALAALEKQNKEQAGEIKELQIQVQTLRDNFTDGMINKISSGVIDFVRVELQGGMYAGK